MKFISFLTLTALTVLAQSTSTLANPSVQNSLIRINSTQQTWSPSQPWDKSAPSSLRALGILLKGNRILTTAETAANAAYIELENAASTHTLPAKVIAIDYESNLALLSPQNENLESFFNGLKHVELGNSAKIGDQVEVWQLEDNGIPLVTHATIQRAEIAASFTSGHYFLTYEAKGSMQSASSSFSVPIIKDEKLLGLLTSYDSKDQIIDIITPEIIHAFLEDTKDGNYAGFPSLGISVSNTVDPNFRLWLKLPEDLGGLYVTKVRKNSAAEKSGILKGDVLLSVQDKDIGRRGYYDDPKYGRLFWSHLIRGTHKVGDQVKINLLREGEKKELTATLSRPEKKLIPSHMIDQAPSFLVKGGFIFQELSGSYLKAFGKDWASTAPLNLLDAMNNPEAFEKGRNKLVFLSASIPTPATTGYERIRNAIIAKVNGQDIADIASLIDAFQSPDSHGLHTIEFVNARPKTIYLDAKLSDEMDAQILQRGIPSLSRK